ncbi:uncharacterized protein LOC131246153 isoform X1 [Magnolia sinica]|uniref:uncharacterized protein LOC131246153 isoform X1 n=1 Tax=Magnolia sinica TaxID=86752 RepID=UPI002659D298|nr:uncharacterized protein LOC131246153 isoform X1 [Magnolia sinica]XP_058102041.1 uncharacterized protein LOC131246153 isoform X1 [Magnolia sinica]
MMPEVPKDSRSHPKQNELGPNYFGYYKHAILELFSQNEDFLSPFSSQGPKSSTRVSEKVKTKEISDYSSNNREAKSCSGSGSLFSGGIGEGLSDSKRDMVKAFLKQSVTDLNQEVDEILDRVLAINQIQSDLREKEPSACCSSALDQDMSDNVCKKQKRSSSPLSNFAHRHIGADGFQSNVQANKDFQLLLEINGLHSEEALRKCSADLSAKLDYMEQHLEEFLDMVMSKCRQMTQAEKQQLRKRIQKLPAKALDRIVEIIQHRKPSSGLSCDEIHVDLENEDNVTLWRLHYYVEAVERANELTSL